MLWMDKIHATRWDWRFCPASNSVSSNVATIHSKPQSPGCPSARRRPVVPPFFFFFGVFGVTFESTATGNLWVCVSRGPRRPRGPCQACGRNTTWPSSWRRRSQAQSGQPIQPTHVGVLGLVFEGKLSPNLVYLTSHFSLLSIRAGGSGREERHQQRMKVSFSGWKEARRVRRPLSELRGCRQPKDRQTDGRIPPLVEFSQLRVHSRIQHECVSG